VAKKRRSISSSGAAAAWRHRGKSVNGGVGVAWRRLYRKAASSAQRQHEKGMASAMARGEIAISK